MTTTRAINSLTDALTLNTERKWFSVQHSVNAISPRALKKKKERGRGNGQKKILKIDVIRAGDWWTWVSEGIGVFAQALQKKIGFELSSFSIFMDFNSHSQSPISHIVTECLLRHSCRSRIFAVRIIHFHFLIFFCTDRVKRC